ncbi:1939_t:CDS:2 [Funneliformis caledonium]|uniref:Diphthine--ammonia ligase n=1 Tax=Funneliformis caledonium TaxID=1117310 RepID=A0A9N8WU27_9GLOM|nr:1939_t:CDS:2 [Funneliformis caledonium]
MDESTNDIEPQEVCLSFTGGKDSTLTLHLISEQTSKYKIKSLVTFTPPHTTKPFLAHPQHLIALQANALSLPHTFLPISPPYLESYRSLITSQKVPYLATGDILDVCNQFMDRVVENTDVKLLRPLWERERNELMELIFTQSNFEIIISCVNLEKIHEKVARKMVGKILTRELYEEIILKQDNVDGCGEMGEYHSMVLNAPLFKKKIVIKKAEQKLSDDEKFLYYLIDECESIDKVNF